MKARTRYALTSVPRLLSGSLHMRPKVAIEKSILVFWGLFVPWVKSVNLLNKKYLVIIGAVQQALASRLCLATYCIFVADNKK